MISEKEKTKALVQECVKLGFFDDPNDKPFDIMSEDYRELWASAEEFCREHFPVLHEVIFGHEDGFFLFHDIFGAYSVYHYDRELGPKGAIVEYRLTFESAEWLQDMKDVKTYLEDEEHVVYNSETQSFFSVLEILAAAPNNENFIGYAKNEEDLKTLLCVTMYIGTAPENEN